MESDSSRLEAKPVAALLDEAGGSHQGPPELGYDMTAGRRKSMALQMSFIIGINTLAPTLIFFLYKHLAGNYKENPALTYTWVTLALGTIELFQWPYRTYLLSRNKFARSGQPIMSEREKGRRRRWLYLVTRQDLFGTLFFLAIVIGAILLTLCCSLGGTRGSFPLLVMSIPSIVLFLGLVIALMSICTAMQLNTPCQISSLSTGQPFRPTIYFFLEDIVAVEGGGGFEFRKRCSRRYEASPPFRRLMQQLSVAFSLWALVLFLFALAVVVANVQGKLDEDIVYAIVVGFSVVWSALSAMAAWQYSLWSLREEMHWWTGHKGSLQGNYPLDLQPSLAV